ncbi:unnamed protein product [Periconia digitata]|uniref:Uncharacterized protein n=1 Tax=Periconia digitata TaxID=1303443 RepID=A0A9W4XN63_9PLEO|nr:unnamed protein product [Periconia digitata]
MLLTKASTCSRLHAFPHTSYKRFSYASTNYPTSSRHLLQPSTMAKSKDSLRLELDRVIACRYPASLVNLAKHLAAADALNIRASISERAPCEVDKLASVVAAALPLWQYTIDILKSLSHSPEFSTHLLIREPTLLDALLHKAIASQNAFEEYAHLCITLLSRRLPDSIPLPASAQSFFLRVFEHSTASGSLDGKLRALYSMLNGACVGLIGLLPFQTRQEFDEKLCSILSSRDIGQSSISMLWCFGLAILAEHPGAFCDDSNDGRSLIATGLEWRTKAGRKIFEHGHKTVNLAYLNVLWATKGGVGVADDEAIEAIRIASRTLQFVEQQTREAWPLSDPRASHIFAKLPSKLLHTEIDAVVRLEALRFYALVAERNKIPPGLVDEYAKSIARTCSVADTHALKECLSMSLPSFAAQLQESNLRFLLKNILQSSSASTPALCMENTRVLCDELVSINAQFPQFRSQMIAALCSSDVEPMLQEFLGIEVSGHNELQPCQSYIDGVRRSLIASIISMILAAALAPGPSKITLPYAVTLALLKKQQHLPAVLSQCNHPARFNNVAPVSLFQQECTPLTGAHLQDWKERLKSELAHQNHFQQDSVVRSVVQICHDLESRCETVEAPLRQEREKSSQLTSEVASLQQRVESLEEQRWEDEQHIAALDADYERCEKEKDQINADFLRLKDESAVANEKASETMHAARVKYDNMKTKLRSSILEYKESAQARELEAGDLRREISTLSDQLHENGQAGEIMAEDLRKEISILSHQLRENELNRQRLVEEAETLKSNLNDMQAKQEIDQQARNQQDAAISSLEGELSDLQNQLKEKESELTAVTDQLSNLQTDHHQLAQSSEANLVQLEKQYEDNLRAAAAKAENEYEQLREELIEVTNIQEATEEAREKLQTDLQKLQNTVIPLLHKQIRDLTAESSHKDAELDVLTAEFDELKQWRNRMFATMGIPPENYTPDNRAAPRSSSSHRRRRKSAAVDPAAAAAPDPHPTISATAIENIANASFTSTSSSSSPLASPPSQPPTNNNNDDDDDDEGGSTPKRPRTRTSFKVPAMHTPYSSKPHALLLPSKSSSSTSSKKKMERPSPNKRAALRPVSPNRRHTTVGFAVPDVVDAGQNLPVRKRRGSLMKEDDADGELGLVMEFDMNGGLAGNAGDGGGGEEEDETVTEL